jgi:hypothetical protein
VKTLPNPGDPIRASDFQSRSSNKGHILFAVIGIFIGIAVTFMVVSRPTPPNITVAQPTVFVDTDSEEAINQQTAYLAKFYEGVYETAIAETVQVQVSDLSLVLRKEVSTAVAQNLDVLEDKVIRRLTPTNNYAGGVTLTPTPQATVACGMANGC